jgi:hypothetical protein
LSPKVDLGYKIDVNSWNNARIFQQGMALILTFALSGCAHGVWIATTPPGAEVLVDGQSIGQTPTSFVDSGGIGHVYRLQLDKPGYARRDIPLPQEWNDGCVAASIVGGVLLFGVPLVGLFWCHALPFSGYQFTLQREGRNSNPPGDEGDSNSLPPNPPADDDSEPPPEGSGPLGPSAESPAEPPAEEPTPKPSPAPKPQKAPKPPSAPSRISI